MCGDLTSAFDFSAPLFGLPALPRPRPRIAVRTCEGLPSPRPRESRPPIQEPGSRPARPVPYQPNAWVSGLINRGEATRLVITMTNEGEVAKKPAQFAVYANAHRADGPWQYTVLPATALSDVFELGEGKYDFTVTGPNRFLRQLSGDARAPGRDLEVVSYYGDDPDLGRLVLHLELANRSPHRVTFQVRAAAYRERDAGWAVQVNAGERSSLAFDQLGHADGWYDFSVRARPRWQLVAALHGPSGDRSTERLGRSGLHGQKALAHPSPGGQAGVLSAALPTRGWHSHAWSANKNRPLRGVSRQS